jgi:hypothetical protein
MALTEDLEAIGGELLGAHQSRVKALQSGRVCAQEGCRTMLSIYNSHDKCALHDFDAEVLRVHPHDAKPAARNGSAHRTWHAAA